MADAPVADGGESRDRTAGVDRVLDVDGTGLTPAELRARVRVLDDDRLREIDETRDRLAAAIDALRARLDGPTLRRELAARMPWRTLAGGVAGAAAGALALRRRFRRGR